ncbi:MAG TPA: ATP-binding protein [Alphaproteobacteria bacterium]|nr:ATP-binding protein [Alphaproteobacteria bacterium]
MVALLQKLPTILVLAVLVGIFIALRQHGRSPRLFLWTNAWLLIFIHFFVQLFAPQQGEVSPLVFAIDVGTLLLAGMFFIASLTSYFHDRQRTIVFLVVTGIPVFLYTAALSLQWESRFIYILCLATIFYGASAFTLYVRKGVPFDTLAWLPAVLALGTWGIYLVWRHNYAAGMECILVLGFTLPGLLFWMRYKRWSPGVVTAAGGFLLWGAVFPVSDWVDLHFTVNPELWNAPKLIVAFGMIVTLLEDKSANLQAASDRERQLVEQLQKFASITSRLLTGVEVDKLCHEIAAAITDTSTFRRAAILISTEQKGLHVAGHSGLTPQLVDELQRRCATWKLEGIAGLCSEGTKLGQNSYLIRGNSSPEDDPLRSQQQFPPNPYWQNGNELVVPLRSSRGPYVGCITLDDPRDPTLVRADEMSKIELLATDLAVTIDNDVLHRQLARSEKLAAIGQLVAGVAHELNNPLASIVGYSELLADEVPKGSAQDRLQKLHREALRMKRIIENLLRFARPTGFEKTSSSIEGLLQEVISLREYHLRNCDISVEVEVEPNLPNVALDEDQFKQILLNLLNNSIDALEETSSKNIRIQAVRDGERISVRFDDTGHGFSDINRIFEPFYTTKPVGKGTGLGLSICYGIVKDHGGEIQAMNLTPSGARILMQLPIHVPQRVTTQ